MSEVKLHFSEHYGIRINLTVGGNLIPGILDTGADTVCVPETVAQALVKQGTIPPPIRTTYVAGANSRQKANVYVMEVGVEGLDNFSKSVEVIGLPTRTALLGRNWLKYVRFTYDGVRDQLDLWTDEHHSVHSSL